ncbi:MAG: agmatine deiminase family protein [Candidatus Cloacimonadota bacterium]
MPQYRSLLFITVMLTLLSPLFAHATLDTDLIYSDFSQRFTETPPPPAQVRPIAEFEPASAVIIRYPLGIPTSLVTHLSNTAEVICVVSSTSVQNQATSAFNSAGVNMSNVSFMIASTDSYWTRDFGPWFIIDGNGIYSVVDFQYNRPRPNDNMFPQIFAQQMGFNLYGMNLQQTGGNYMTDGINTAAQTQIAYSENSGQGQTGVNLKMQNYMGITSTTWFRIPIIPILITSIAGESSWHPIRFSSAVFPPAMLNTMRSKPWQATLPI